MSGLVEGAPTAYREYFSTTKHVAALLVYPKECAGSILKALRGSLYAQRGVRSVLDAPSGLEAERGASPPPFDAISSTAKMLLLDPGVLDAAVVEALLARSEGGGVSATSSRWWLLPLAPAAREELGLPLDVVTKLNTVVGGPRLCYVAVTTHKVALSYKNYTMAQLLKTVLASPAAAPCDSPGQDHVPLEEGEGAAAGLRGFEQVGHIAHLNLSAAHVPHRFTIGQVILDCNPTVTVVVNKVDSISSVFREFKMDVIAVRDGGHSLPGAAEKGSGCDLDELLTATVRQHGCVFRVPYNRVYWNSRLSHEHTRLVNNIHRGDFLFDVMAGVGPFAIPAAMRGAVVFANDLNPVAVEYLRINARLNAILEMCEGQEEAGRLRAYNMDGRDFLKCVLYENVLGSSRAPDAHAGDVVAAGERWHVVMNLPALAVEFLDVFSPAAAHSPWRRRPLEAAAAVYRAVERLVFHVYCFTPSNDAVADAVRQVERHMGYDLPPENQKQVQVVRDVAPLKWMVCVSFTLPAALWESQVIMEAGDVGHSPLKARRLE